MIVVTGSARTGTSLMMRILKEIGLHVPAPKFFAASTRMKKYNPDGYYEIPEDQQTGMQHHEYKGMAVKLFGYSLSQTPKAFVSKIIVCKRDRTAAVESSKVVFKALYTDQGRPNHAEGVEDLYYDAHYRMIDVYVKDMSSLDVHLEDMKADPFKELGRIGGFLGVDITYELNNKIIKTIHRFPLATAHI